MKWSVLQQESAEPLLFNFLAFWVLVFFGKDLHILWHAHLVPYRLSTVCSLPPLHMHTFPPLLSPVLQVVLVPEGSCYSSSVAATPTWSR